MSNSKIIENRGDSKNKPNISDPAPQIQQKNYINLYFFKLSENLIVTYLYLIASILLNIVNRVLYQKYNFKFNFTLLFLQQLFCAIFFKLISVYSKTFNQKVGDISFSDFKRNKGQYLFFCMIFIINYFSSFVGNQKVNTAMFLVLRKFLTVMNYLYDRYINKKSLPNYFTQSVMFICLGSIMTGYGDLTSEGLGYLIVFFNNSLSVFYAQMTDSFSKKNGVSNLKLLVYNGYLATPILFACIFISGEYKSLMAYDGLCLGLYFWLMLSLMLTIVLNSSYFLSNEKNSSLFTQLLSNCKVKNFFIFYLGYFYYLDCHFCIK
jgi:hypothetical protein